MFCHCQLLPLHFIPSPLNYLIALAPYIFIVFHSKPFKLAGFMALSTSKPALAKQLRELLQEQQEPFALDVYLSERRYMKKSFNSEGRNGCRTINSAKNLKKPCSFDLNKKGTRIRYASTILRSVLNVQVSGNASHNLSNCNSRAHKQIADTNGLSSASNLTLSNSYSKSAVQEDSPSAASTSRALKLIDLKELEAATDTKLQTRRMDDKKQVGRVSVVKELPPNEVRYFHITRQEETPSTSSFILPKNATEDSIFSASLWELLIYLLIEKQNHAGVEELPEIIGSSSSQYLKTKRVLQQTKQLLFDCVKEAIETHERKGKIWKYTREFLGPEELGKIIADHICSWGKQSGDVTNITQLIHLDFSSTIEEWSNFQRLTREIGKKMANEIMDEIVMEKIDLFLQ